MFGWCWFYFDLIDTVLGWIDIIDEVDLRVHNTRCFLLLQILQERGSRMWVQWHPHLPILPRRPCFSPQSVPLPSPDTTRGTCCLRSPGHSSLLSYQLLLEWKSLLLYWSYFVIHRKSTPPSPPPKYSKKSTVWKERTKQKKCSAIGILYLVTLYINSLTQTLKSFSMNLVHTVRNPYTEI